MAVLQLGEAGALAFNDPVDAYLDHYEQARGDPITIAELWGTSLECRTRRLGSSPRR